MNYGTAFGKLSKTMRDYSKNNSKGSRSSQGNTRFPLIRIIIALTIVLVFYQLLTKDNDSEKTAPQTETPLKEKIKNANIKENKTEIKPEPVKKLPPGKSFTQQFEARQPDRLLGKKLLNVLKSQNPYGGFYLMVDGTSGQILAWGQQDKFKPSSRPSYLASSSFPAASLSKIITAAAALESRRYSNHTLIPSKGSSVTLYSNQLRIKKNYSGNKVSLERAFASSMNPPMGLVGLQIGGKAMRKTSAQLGFNFDFPNGMPQRSIYEPPDTGFGVAEAASGFTTKITISPLHAAAIIRSILREETPEIPWSPVVGNRYAPIKPIRLETQPFSHNTYYGMRRMFEATISKGSARTPFRSKNIFYPNNKKRLRVGGKTGTKDGGKFRYEWFAGYAYDRKKPENAVIVVCLHINELSGTRASTPSQAAALLLNHWAKKYL